MPELSISVKPEFLTVLSELTHDIAQYLQNHLAIPIDFDDADPDLADACKESLQQNLHSDCEYLLFLLDDDRLGKETLSIEPEFAEPVLRACSAVRIIIRSTLIKNISEEQLNSPKINFKNFSPAEKKGYDSYTFLASIQESLLHSMDSTLQEIQEL